MDPGCTEGEGLEGLGSLALGSEGEAGAGMTQSFWFGQMGGRWHHVLSCGGGGRAFWFACAEREEAGAGPWGDVQEPGRAVFTLPFPRLALGPLSVASLSSGFLARARGS